NRGSIGAEAGLKSPQLFAGFRVERAKESVSAAMEQEATRGGQHAAAEARKIRDFFLPDLLVGARIERGDQAILTRARYGEPPSRAEFARRNAGGEKEKSGLRIVSAGGPVARS